MPKNTAKPTTRQRARRPARKQLSHKRNTITLDLPPMYDETADQFVETVCLLMNDKHKTTGSDIELPPAVDEVIERFLYELEQSTYIHIWNIGDIARVALPYMLEATEVNTGTRSDMSMMLATLRVLCTKAEYAAFEQRAGLKSTPRPPTKQTRDYQAGVTLARLLADPRTPAATRLALQDGLIEFTNQANIIVDHPALARRAFALCVDEMSKRRRGQYAKQETAQRRRIYNDLMALLAEAEG
jgi:hypothetical protein